MSNPSRSDLINQLMSDLGISQKNDKSRLAINAFAAAIHDDLVTTGRRWLIWNHERSMWWKRSTFGYTHSIHEAGRFTYNEAFELIDGGNRIKMNESQEPQDSMVHEV